MFPLNAILLSLLAAFLYRPLASQDDFSSTGNTNPSRTLLLTAHPDDEAMFFAPTILSLTQNQASAKPTVQTDSSSQSVFSVDMGNEPSYVYSLCLSVGNADGLGQLRKTELGHSLDILGVPENQRWVIDHPDLQDNITLHWDPATISEVIKPYILEHRISTILTFDYQGISDHPNHKALPLGAKKLLQTLPKGISRPRLFGLISVPTIGKYNSIVAPTLAKFDLYLSKALQHFELQIITLLEQFQLIPESNSQPVTHNQLWPVFISGVPQYRRGFQAMLAHKSQLVWFRWLYLLSSRYMWVNEWVEIKI